jgi:imidazolonepropionase-like amidohydrolase
MVTIGSVSPDGPEQVRAAVRYQVKYGADVIKTCATGGVLSEGDAVGATQYTYEELKALVDEAHKLERKVAAHAHGTEGIKIATRAGVSSIEHGSFLDVEGAKMMAEKGTYLVPTLLAGENVERLAKTGVLKGFRGEKALAAAAAMRNAIKIAIANKVPIALGTDAGVYPHGLNAHEFTLLVEWGGMRPMDAIIAGTIGSAKLLGWDQKLGSLTVGKIADIVAVPGDPLADIKRMESTVFVMKNGFVYKEIVDRQIAPLPVRN